MKLISLSGLDGSGKTSQIHYLKDFLEDHGKTVHHFHAIKFSIANKLAALVNREKNGESPKAKTQASRFSIFLRKIALIADAYRFNKLHAKLKKQDVDYVLTDRYFYDQMINIIYLSRGNEFDANRWWQRFAEKFIIPPDHALFLEVTPHTIMLRKSNIEQGLDYLERKYKLYEYYANTRNFVRIDGEQSKNGVLQDIKQALKFK